MGRRVKVAETREEAKAEKDLVKELTGKIIERAVKNGWTRQELASRAKKKSASTLYGWRNGTRKNPSLLDLQAFARAVGLDVRLLPENAHIDDTGSVVDSAGRRLASLKPETVDVVKVMEDASDELRVTIKEKVLKLLTERASHPLEADELAGPGTVRSSKS